MTLLNNRQLEEMYDEMLDDVYGDIEICGYHYPASKALFDVDPTAYRCGFNDWLDSMIQDEILFQDDDENVYDEKPIPEGMSECFDCGDLHDGTFHANLCEDCCGAKEGDE